MIKCKELFKMPEKRYKTRRNQKPETISAIDECKSGFF
jgi:hypothetical protein